MDINKILNRCRQVSGNMVAFMVQLGIIILSLESMFNYINTNKKNQRQELKYGDSIVQHEHSLLSTSKLKVQFTTLGCK